MTRDGNRTVIDNFPVVVERQDRRPSYQQAASLFAVGHQRSPLPCRPELWTLLWAPV